MRYALAAVLIAAPAAAQQQCMGLTDALDQLHAQHGESVVADALTSDGQMMVITAAPNGAWTLLLVRPDMTACLAGHGTSYGAHEPEPAGEDS